MGSHPHSTSPPHGMFMECSQPRILSCFYPTFCLYLLIPTILLGSCINVIWLVRLSWIMKTPCSLSCPVSSIFPGLTVHFFVAAVLTLYAITVDLLAAYFSLRKQQLCVDRDLAGFTATSPEPQTVLAQSRHKINLGWLNMVKFHHLYY